MAEKNLVERRYCRESDIESVLFFKAWMIKEGTFIDLRNARRCEQVKKWSTVRFSSRQCGQGEGD